MYTCRISGGKMERMEKEVHNENTKGCRGIKLAEGYRQIVQKI